MESMAIASFLANCLDVLEKVRRTGRPVLILRSGEPLAEIVPPPTPVKPQRWLGALRSTGRIVGDIVSPASEEAAWDVLRT
jgi:antitoxin (DNA-binding transcriptional repressor) of toxin-antitoxin stability system